MPNRNYERGRRFEYVLMEELKKIGARFVVRGAGSHGGDIVAIFFDDVWYIEAKSTKLWPPPLYEEEKNKLFQQARHVSSLAASIYFVIRCSRRGVIWLELQKWSDGHAWLCNEVKTTVSTDELADLGWLAKAERVIND